MPNHPVRRIGTERPSPHARSTARWLLFVTQAGDGHDRPGRLVDMRHLSGVQTEPAGEGGRDIRVVPHPVLPDRHSPSRHVRPWLVLPADPPTPLAEPAREEERPDLIPQPPLALRAPNRIRHLAPAPLRT